MNEFYYKCNKCNSKEIKFSNDTKYCKNCLSNDIWCHKKKEYNNENRTMGI